MKFFPFWLVLVVAPFVLTSCGGNFLIGKWTLDRETTIAQFNEDRDRGETNPGEGFLKELFSGLQKGVSHLVLSQFEGVQLEFTGSELRRIRGGSGEAMGYKIIERPAGGRLVLQYENGDIFTWARSENGIRMRLPGEDEYWVCFKRIQ